MHIIIMVIIIIIIHLYLARLVLSNNTIESVLHAVSEVIRGLSDRFQAVSEHLAHVLQRGLVSLDGLEGLGASHEGLDVIGLVLQHVGGVLDGAVEVRELLVAGRSVVVALDRELAALVGDGTESLGVRLDGSLKIGILELRVALLLHALLAIQASNAVLLGALVQGAHTVHQLSEGGVGGVKTQGAVDGLVGPGVVLAAQLALGQLHSRLHLLHAVRLLELPEHLLEVGVGRLDAEAALHGFQGVVDVVEVLQGQGEAEVTLHEAAVRDDAAATVLRGLVPLSKGGIARTNTGTSNESLHGCESLLLMITVRIHVLSIIPSVGEEGNIGGVGLDGLGVLGDGLAVVLGLEEVVALAASINT